MPPSTGITAESPIVKCRSLAESLVFKCSPNCQEQELELRPEQAWQTPPGDNNNAVDQNLDLQKKVETRKNGPDLYNGSGNISGSQL